MWRQLAIVFVAVMTVPLGVAEIVTTVEAVQRAARAQEAREAQRLDKAASVSRWQAEALEQASVDRDAAKVHAEELQQALDAANARADQAEAKVAALQAVSYRLGSGPATQSPQPQAAAGPNHFPWGWCTWWVASKRWIPWNGNAINWLAGARAFGYPTGSTPRVGAIMVTAESWYGHVAIVESVSAGNFTVSEMNYSGWGMVDWRTIIPGRVPIMGFIYG
jgi:peptidoglycan DL-endopeptidase CwlO